MFTGPVGSPNTSDLRIPVSGTYTHSQGFFKGHTKTVFRVNLLVTRIGLGDNRLDR